MALSKVREYINTTIESIDSTLEEWKSPFDGENIPETKSDKSYYIKYDLESSTNDQQTVTDIVGAEIGFYFKTFKKEIDTYDEGMDLVNEIRLKLLSKSNIQSFISTDNNPISEVTCDSQEGDFIDSNKKQIKITLTLGFRIIQVIC